MTTLAQFKMDNATYRVRYVWREIIVDATKPPGHPDRVRNGVGYSPFPIDPEEGWRYYQKESGMRSPQAAVRWWSQTGRVKSQVQKRDDQGNWVEIPNYDWN